MHSLCCSSGFDQFDVIVRVGPELVEQGFEVAVVKDATAGPHLPEGDGYLAARPPSSRRPTDDRPLHSR